MNACTSNLCSRSILIFLVNNRDTPIEYSNSAVIWQKGFDAPRLLAHFHARKKRLSGYFDKIMFYPNEGFNSFMQPFSV